jgi:hypothetical protein
MDNTESQTAGDCGCKGTGPRVTTWARSLEPPASVMDHFRQARIEFLKGIRELVDHRIQKLSRTDVKGTKVTVE